MFQEQDAMPDVDQQKTAHSACTPLSCSTKRATDHPNGRPDVDTEMNPSALRPPAFANPPPAPLVFETPSGIRGTPTTQEKVPTDALTLSRPSLSIPRCLRGKTPPPTEWNFLMIFHSFQPPLALPVQLVRQLSTS